MITIENCQKMTLEINKSKFISFAYCVNSEDDVMLKIENLKKEYSDATHICYAYSIKSGAYFFDDGEPSGTAGKPILNVIQKSGLSNILVVVVRYFGGIKLGAGPLTRAYSKVASLTIEASTQKELKSMLEIAFHISFEQAFNIYLLLNLGQYSLKSRVGNDFVILCEKQNKNEVLRQIKSFDISNVVISEVLV